MKLFLDTANIDEIRQGAQLGVISGITTNPSLAAKEGLSSHTRYRQSAFECCNVLLP